MVATIELARLGRTGHRARVSRRRRGNYAMAPDFSDEGSMDRSTPARSTTSNAEIPVPSPY